MNKYGIEQLLRDESIMLDPSILGNHRLDAAELDVVASFRSVALPSAIQQLRDPNEWKRYKSRSGIWRYGDDDHDILIENLGAFESLGGRFYDETIESGVQRRSVADVIYEQELAFVMQESIVFSRWGRLKDEAARRGKAALIVGSVEKQIVIDRMPYAPEARAWIKANARWINIGGKLAKRLIGLALGVTAADIDALEDAAQGAGAVGGIANSVIIAMDP